MSDEDERTASLMLATKSIDAVLELEGWDHPPKLFTVAPSDFDLGDDRETVDSALVLIAEGEPYGMLEEAIFGSDVEGLLLAFEAWSWPENVPQLEQVGRPSDHPERIELRSVILVTRDGLCFSTVRERGQEPELIGGGGGPLIEAMHAALERNH